MLFVAAQLGFHRSSVIKAVSKTDGGVVIMSIKCEGHGRR